MLFRHQELPYEVRGFYQPCGQVPRCNCGAAVRVDASVIRLTACVPGEGIHVQVFGVGELQAGTAVRRYDGGDRYEVSAPPRENIVY